jgi:cardiolipin synthase A/B
MGRFLVKSRYPEKGGASRRHARASQENPRLAAALRARHGARMQPIEGDHLTVAGNRLTLLTEGPERLAALLALIDGAERSLRVLYYIYREDGAGAAIRDALARAAARGVQVSLIVDALGSEPTPDDDFFAPLRAAGAFVCEFVPRWGRRYLLRNHQKLTIADEARAIIGGFNIQDSYFGTREQGAWRDLGLLIEGPAVARLSPYFDALAAWARSSRARLGRLRRLLKRWSEPEGTVRWLLGGPTRRLSPWARVVRRDMLAGGDVSIIAAYFAPTPAMLRRLDKAAQRGRVRVVLPSRLDHGAAIWGARFTYAGLLRKGVEVYEYQPTKLHTKLFVIGDVVHIGSANFDVRSLYLNLELMLRVEDAAFAARVRAYVDGEVADSEAITPELHRARSPWWVRVKQAAAYFVMAVLDYNVSRRLNFGPERR